MAENSKNEIPDYPWYSWGSPIGLGIIIISLSVSFAVTAFSLASVFVTIKAAIGG